MKFHVLTVTLSVLLLPSLLQNLRVKKNAKHTPWKARPPGAPRTGTALRAHADVPPRGHGDGREGQHEGELAAAGVGRADGGAS